MPTAAHIDALRSFVASLSPVREMGRVSEVRAGVVEISGLARHARIGDRVRINRNPRSPIRSEVVQLKGDRLIALPEEVPDGVALGAPAVLLGPATIAPSEGWLGRIIDPDARPLDGRALQRGSQERSLNAAPPDAAKRRSLGKRLSTGMAVTNTFLPLVQGQRMGLFAGSGVGKSSLLGALAGHIEADVVVIAMIGERGREVRQFVEDMIGPEGMARTVVVAATSDQSPLKRRRCGWTAMTVAEYFRDLGKSVLLLADSITRFAEAHREVAVAAGEAPVVRGFPPSTAPAITALCERAGPGQDAQGDITALFTVLVAGSDMEEPIADIMRGVLDGHVVLDRAIAERGRYPAVDVLQSVSRSLPAAASDEENAILAEARRLLALYDRNAVMIRAGLHVKSVDPDLDLAIDVWPELDAFIGQIAPQGCAHSFQQLNLILRRAGATRAKAPPTA